MLEDIGLDDCLAADLHWPGRCRHSYVGRRRRISGHPYPLYIESVRHPIVSGRNDGLTVAGQASSRPLPHGVTAVTAHWQRIVRTPRDSCHDAGPRRLVRQRHTPPPTSHTGACAPDASAPIRNPSSTDLDDRRVVLKENTYCPYRTGGAPTPRARNGLRPAAGSADRSPAADQARCRALRKAVRSDPIPSGIVRLGVRVRRRDPGQRQRPGGVSQKGHTPDRGAGKSASGESGIENLG